MKHIKLMIIPLLMSTLCCHKSKDTTGRSSVASNYHNEIAINDSTSLKLKVIKELSSNIKDLAIDKTEIKRLTTIGERKEQVYFIQFTDLKKQRRIAKYLFLNKNQFFFYENLMPKIDPEDEAFYQSYYVCYGSNKPECSPNIAILDGHKVWGAGSRMVCDPDDPCKNAQVLVL